LLAAFVLMVITPILQPIMIWFQTRRGYLNLKGFQKNLQYLFSSDGYDVLDEKSSSHISWDSILKVVETNHSFNLFFHKAMFHVVPKRCIEQQGDVDRLRSILKQNLGNKAKLNTLG
jgi:YcxB-like protein